MGQGKIKVVVVETEICIGSGGCVRVYPEMFQLADEEQERAVPQMQGGWDDEMVLKAAKACPVCAIVLIDKNQRQAYP